MKNLFATTVVSISLFASVHAVGYEGTPRPEPVRLLRAVPPAGVIRFYEDAAAVRQRNVTLDLPSGSQAAERVRLELFDDVVVEGELERVEVPATARLGGEAGSDVRRLLNNSRVAIAALQIGLSRSALDYAVPYAKEREAFDQAIAQKQAIAFMLADIQIEDQGTYWLIRAQDEIRVDMERVSQELGRPLSLSMWLVIMTSFVGRAQPGEDYFLVTSKMVDLESLPD